MEKESKESSGHLQTQGVLWIALLAAGLALVRVLPLETSRPQSSPADVAEHVATQDVDARLWQDPIGAVGRERKAQAQAAGNRGDKAPAPDRHSVGQFVKTIRAGQHPSQGAPLTQTAQAATPIFLAVMVQGGPYPEDAEARRRIRYAVLAAMSRNGYVASDPDHLGYFDIPLKSRGTGPKELPKFVAYEKFEHDPVWAHASRTKIQMKAQPAVDRGRAAVDKRDVWLLWLDESFFMEQVVDKTIRLARLLDDQPCEDSRNAASGAGTASSNRFIVLGPTSSYALRDMAQRRIDEPGQSKCLTFYSYSATASSDDILANVSRASTSHEAASSGRGAGRPMRSQEQATPQAPAQESGSARGQVFEGAGEKRLSQFFQNEKGLTVYRTMTTDVMLAHTIARELGLRGINPEQENINSNTGPAPEIVPRGAPIATATAGRGARVAAQADCSRKSSRWQHVVLIADWDTFYSRSAQKAIGDALGGSNGCRHEWVHRFNYPRGLDGRLPVSHPIAAGADKLPAQVNDARPAPEDRQRSIERAEGESQYDYLRRLGQQLLALDRELFRHEHGRIRAIGVLGSDVHDKLLLLQALRPQFPDAVFFTTDLDARFLHPRELEYSRNLLVASSYGLELEPALQSSTPPFRNSYQTASYLTTLVALHNAHDTNCGRPGASASCIDQARISDWLSEPRLFQIASDAAFDLSGPGMNKVPVPTADWAASDPRKSAWERHDANCSALWLGDCLAVHPAPLKFHHPPAARTTAQFLVLLLFALWTLALVTGGLHRRRYQALPSGATIATGGVARSTKVLLAASCVVLVLVVPHSALLQLLWNAVADWLTERGLGEPFTLGGISVWPAVAANLLILSAALSFLAWGWRALDTNADRMAEEMQFKPKRQEIVDIFNRQNGSWSFVDKLLQAFSFSAKPEDFIAHPGLGMSPSALAFWHKYLYQSRWKARLMRITLATALYAAAAGWVAATLGEPSVPSRGQLSAGFDWFTTHAANLAACFLIWFVVDSTVLCVMFIREIKDKMSLMTGYDDTSTAGRNAHFGTIWPDEVLEKHAKPFGMREQYIESWISLRCIDLRTRLVGSLVYLPFSVLSLMILLQNALSHTWSVPLGLSLFVGCSVLIVAGCAISIRVAAEGARRRAIQTLETEAIRLSVQADSKDRQEADQLQALVQLIQTLRTGAFGPYSQQPVFKALILPLATYGGTFFLEYLSMKNL